MGGEVQPTYTWPTMPLAECMLELRRAMEPCITLSDDAILEGATPQERSLIGQTRATIPRKTQLVPAKVPAKEAAPMEELAPVKVSTKEAAHIEEPTNKKDPVEDPLRSKWQQRPMPVSQWESWIFLLHGMRTKERERFPIVITLAGWRYCILPSQ